MSGRLVDAGGRVLRGLREDPAPALLVALPVFLLALNSQWIWSGPYRDAWLYYGYFQNGLDYLTRFPSLYYGSRLSVILPGWLAHHLLPVWAANLALHLSLYWLAILSFYSTARELFGGRAALLASVILGCQTFFLFAMGWNYVDGFGVGYFLLALAALTHSARSPGRPWRLALAGAASCAMVAANIGYVVYLAPLGLAFVVLNRRGTRRALLPALGWFAAGAALVFLSFCALSRAAGGPWFFLEPSVSFARDFVPKANPFRDPTYKWLRAAHHLVFPAAIAVAAVGVLSCGFRRIASRRPPAESLLAQALLVMVWLGISWGQVYGDTAQLQNFYYSSYLTPLAALALAGMLAPLLYPLPGRVFNGVVGCTVVFLGLPLLVRLNLAGLRALAVPPTLWSLAAGLLGLAGLLLWRRWRLVVVVVVALFGVQSFLVKEIPRHFRRPGLADRRAGALFLQMDRAISLIDRVDLERGSKVWYDMQSPYGGVFDAIACALSLTRVVNLEFPALSHTVAVDGKPLEPPVRIVVLSDRRDASARAAEALAGVGLGGQLVAELVVPGPVPHFNLTFLEVIPQAETATSK